MQVDDFLDNFLILQDTFSCNSVYSDDVCFTELYTHRVMEIDIVVAGNGIHRVLDQAIPCKKSDLYIFKPNISHRYFVAEEGESLTVHRLLFDPKDWFDGDITQPTSPRFCYGVFLENAMFAYAMSFEKTE